MPQEAFDNPDRQDALPHAAAVSPRASRPDETLHRRTNPKRWTAFIATGFVLAWLLILLAGADHPPPIGFLGLIPLLLLGGLVIYWRMPVYARWKSSARPWRLFRVVAEGAVAGLVVAMLLAAAPWSGEPGIRLTSTGRLVGLLALSTLGAVHALIAYWLTKRGQHGRL